MRLAIIAALAMLGGCANSTRLYTPDGRTGYLLNCSGWARSWGMCMKRAGDLCGVRGYDMYERRDDNSWAMIGLMPTELHNREMMIACK